MKLDKSTENSLENKIVDQHREYRPYLKLGESTEIINIEIFNADTGKKYEQYTRQDRRNHFMNEFLFEKYHIQLRFHWEDSNEEPTLDADIWTVDESGGKEFLDKGDWHHTKPKQEEEIMFYRYEFKFDNCELNLKIKRKIAKTGILDGKVVIKNSSKID